MSKERKKPSTAPAISTFMADKNSVIRNLYEHANKLLELQRRLRQTLPAPLDGQIKVASLTDGILTIHTSSAAWAARLRFKIPDMLRSLDEESCSSSVKTIRIKVNPPDTPLPEMKQKLTLSPQTAQLLQEVADSISDPELSESLHRLASH